jgi:hypothetical protein
VKNIYFKDMRVDYKNILIFFIIAINGISYGQNIQEKRQKHNFASDGQEYIILIKNNRTTKITVVFYPDLEYKINFNPETGSSIVKMDINNLDGKLLYTNSDKKFAKEWNFKFQSLINATINLKLINKLIKEETVRVHITFRKAEKEPEKMSLQNE